MITNKKVKQQNTIRDICSGIEILCFVRLCDYCAVENANVRTIKSFCWLSQRIWTKSPLHLNSK